MDADAGPSGARRTSKVRITYRSPGARPPVYLAGSLTSPPWQPQEMQYFSTGDQQLEFYKDLSEVVAGRHQYKFRLGPGDWWVLDGTAPKGSNMLLLFIDRAR